MDRRTFVKVAGASVGVASRLVAANDKIAVAVIGVNGRGSEHVAAMTELSGVEVAYVCDVDDRAIAKGLAKAGKQANAPKTLKDFREALADPSIDAITIATPDHWHAPMAILGLAAGKHVYVEKPLCHNLYEGELTAQAVAKYKRVLQMGAQRRSFPNLQQAIRELHDGAIGKTYFARGWYTNNRASIGYGKSAAVPGELDYELWQGPAPRRAYVDNLVPYNWHWNWHWGTGEALNNGTHEMDVARWALGVSWPTRVSSNGGRYQWKDDWQTPDTQTISWDFPEGKSMTWEGRSCCGFNSEGLDRGVMVYGTDGAALLDSNSYKFYDKKKKLIKEVADVKDSEGTNVLSASGRRLDKMHIQNFLESVRGNATPNCPVEEGQKSVGILHLGNISWRMGRELYCEPLNGHIKNDAEAMKLWRRDYEPGWEPKV